jgi:hypothetical protein
MEENSKKVCCECGCVGYAYVPEQQMGELYDSDKGLRRGTIFPELDLSMCEYGKVCKQCGGELDG